MNDLPKQVAITLKEEHSKDIEANYVKKSSVEELHNQLETMLKN